MAKIQISVAITGRTIKGSTQIETRMSARALIEFRTFPEDESRGPRPLRRRSPPSRPRSSTRPPPPAPPRSEGPGRSRRAGCPGRRARRPRTRGRARPADRRGARAGDPGEERAERKGDGEEAVHLHPEQRDHLLVLDARAHDG